jgi:hypothetical protein
VNYSCSPFTENKPKADCIPQCALKCINVEVFPEKPTKGVEKPTIYLALVEEATAPKTKQTQMGSQ